MAYHDHFLLFKLMDPVNASFLDAVGSLFLTEAGRIAGKGLGELLLRNDGIDEFSDHGMLAGTDQIQVFALDLIHHGVHFSKAHNAGDHVAADHERRHAVGEAPADHKIPGIGDHCGVKPCDVSH